MVCRTSGRDSMKQSSSAAHPQHFHGIACVFISKSRRISLPKRFRIQLPYCLVEVTPDIGGAAGQWLIVCEPKLLPHLKAEFGQPFPVLSEYRTHRPTFSQPICEKFLFAPGGSLRLNGCGSYFEIWSETAWWEKLEEAFRPDSVLPPAFYLPG